MKKAQIDLTVFANEDFPLQVQCENQNFGQPPLKAVIARAPKEVRDCITDGFHYVGWVLGGIVTIGGWNAAGRGSSCMLTSSIIKIGWEPDFDWSQLPACVRYITRNPLGVWGSSGIAMWENRPAFNGRSWHLGDDAGGHTVPVRWLGLEDWEGGPDALLERSMCE